MTKTIENLFIYTAVYTALIPIGLYIFFWKRLNKVYPLLIIIIYSLIEFLTNLVSDELRSQRSQLVILYSFFTIVEYALFACFFYLLISNIKIRKIIIVASIAFMIFSCCYFLFVKYRFLDSVPIGVETILVLTYAFYYLFEQLEPTTNSLIYQRYHFWLVAGIMIYLAGSFFIYIFANQVDNKTRHDYWVFQNAFTILKNMCFGISIITYTRNKKLPFKTNHAHFVN